MRVVLQIPPRLARYADGNGLLELEGKTLEEVFECLRRKHPDLASRLFDESGRLYPYLAIIHNERQVTAEELERITLRDRDTLEIVSLASGG